MMKSVRLSLLCWSRFCQAGIRRSALLGTR